MTSSASIGALRVTLGLDTAQFEKGTKRARQEMDAVSRAGRATGNAIRGLAGIAATLGTVLIGAFSGQAVKGALDYAASLGEVSQAAGVTVEQLQIYRQLGTQVNLTTAEVDKGLGKLTLSLGKAALGAKIENDALRGLNIQLRDTDGNVRATGDVLLDLADRIANIKDPAEQAAAAYALFGRQGQKWLPLLSQGRKGLEEFARAAKESGAIIGTDLSNAADRASDKMALLNEQFKSRFANLVSQHADSIYSFAEATSAASVGLAKFVAEYGKFAAIVGGAGVGRLVGSAVLGGRVGGLPGAIVGGALGFAGGVHLSREAREANSNLQFRQKEQRAALEYVESLQKIGGFAADPKNPVFRKAVDNLKKQTALLRSATADYKKVTSTKEGGDFTPDEFLGSGGGSGGGGGSKAASDSARNTAQFENEREQLRIDLLRAEADYTQSILLRRDASIAALDEEQASYERNIALDDELTAAQKQELVERQRALTAQRKKAVEQEYGVELTNKESELIQSSLRAQIDAAQVKADLADNSRDVLAAELELFDLYDRLRLAELDRVLATEATASAIWQAAADERQSLEDTRAGRREAVAQRYATPAQRFRDSLNLSAGQLNDAVDQIKINGLERLSDALTDAIVNFKSLADVARNVVQSVLSELLRLQIQQAIIKPLAAAIGIPGFAKGTNFAPGGLALVGERGPELVNLKRGSQVIPNDVLGKMGGGVTINLTMQASGNPKADRESASQVATVLRHRLTPMRGM